MRVRDGEPIGAALRRFKKLLDRNGYWREIRQHAEYAPPTQARRKKKFKKRLKARQATLDAQATGEQPCASWAEAVATLKKRTGKP